MAKKKTHEQYVADLKKLNKNIDAVDTYINSATKILHRCLIDGHEWYVAPRYVLQGIGCPICGGSMKKTHEQYVEEVKKLNKNIEVVGTYINSATKILHRCLIDNHEWYAAPTSILSGTGCPKCNTSKGEKAIEEWLNKNDVIYESQKIFKDCRYIRPLPFDFYLPEYNICIEYQGKQHYEPVKYFGGQEELEKRMVRDSIKEKYCNEHNMILFKIDYFEDVYKKLEKLNYIVAAKEVAV